MRYMGTNASRMTPGACTPATCAPTPLMTMNPRAAARLYAGAVDATPTTTLESRPSAPGFNPLLSTSLPVRVGAGAVMDASSSTGSRGGRPVGRQYTPNEMQGKGQPNHACIDFSATES